MAIVGVFFRLLRNCYSFRGWRDNETRGDIEKWQSAPVFCTGCFESDAAIRGRIVFALAIIQGLKIRDEVGRLDDYIAKSRIRVKKKRTVSLARISVLDKFLRIMRK